MRSILLLFLFISAHSFSQKKNDVQLMTINYPEYTVKTQVLQNHKKINADVNLVYAWYKSNMIIETTGGYDGKILHGAYSSFYLNNNLKEKGLYKKGLKEGKWIKWFPDGKIMEISNWKNGLKNGKYIHYDEKGQKIIESEYKNGKLHGRSLTFIAGKEVSQKKYRHDVEIPQKEKKPKIVKVRQTSKELKKPGKLEKFKEKRKIRREKKEKEIKEKDTSKKQKPLFKKPKEENKDKKQ